MAGRGDGGDREEAKGFGNGNESTVISLQARRCSTSTHLIHGSAIRSLDNVLYPFPSEGNNLLPKRE
jgi:hypothetical protein